MIETILVVVWALGWFWFAYDWFDSYPDIKPTIREISVVILCSILWPLWVIVGMFILGVQAYDRLR